MNKLDSRICKVFIENKPFSFEVSGDFFWGEPEVLFKEDDNIISKVVWKDLGYCNVKVFSENEFFELKKSVRLNIMRAIKEAGILFDEDIFELYKYHKVVKTDRDHNKVINITRNLVVDDLNFDIDILVKRFGSVLGYKLTSWVKELAKSHIQIRISRPNSLDINPPHRDGYLSYWEDIINAWIPISGCNSETSLPVVEGSHLLPENHILRTKSKGAVINGNRYYVPCILESINGNFRMIRPNPKEGESLLFTPFLIHGSAINQSVDKTRIALELRFPKL